MKRFDFVSGYEFEGKKRVLKDDKWGIVDHKDSIVVPTEYDYLRVISRLKLIEYIKGNHYGVMTFNGDVIIEGSKLIAVYENEEKILLKVKNKEGFVGLCNKQGKIILPFIYKDIEKIYNDLFLIKYYGDKEEVYNIKTKKKILDSPYKLHKDSACNNMLIIEDDKGSIGVCDLNGKVVIPTEYESADYTYDTFFYMNKKDGFDIFDFNCKFQKTINGFKFVEGYRNGDIIVKKNGKVGLININEEIIIEPQYEDIEVRNKQYVVTKNGKSALMSEGSIITPFKYEEISCTFAEDYYIIYVDGKEGLIDKNGEEKIKPIYEYLCCDDIEKGYLVFEGSSGKYGVLDLEGNKILDEIYDWIIDIEDGRFTVELNGEAGYVII